MVGQDEEARRKVLDQIEERQSAIEDANMSYNPMAIFAEGTTTNGTHIIKFKRGAFASLRTVVPVFIKVGPSYMNPIFECMEFFPMMVQYFSSFSFHHLRMTIMPEFVPTTWMLNNH